MGRRTPADPDRDARWRGWMAAAQEGDAASYERLLRELLPVLRGFVRSRLADPTAAEDAVQNTLLAIHRARHTFRPERPFGPWWRAIARNAVIDLLRERGRRQREVALEDVELAARPSDSEPRTPSPALERALAKLPDSQRQAVQLIHLEGLSVAEAAARARVTPGALKVRAHRGYRALRKLLGEDPR